MEEHTQIRYYADVLVTSIEWLWYPYIPFGKITLVQGDPGEGKSTMALKLAASISNGTLLPDGHCLATPATVIYQCAEDGKGDTIRPRLEGAGADCERIAFIDEGGDALTLADACFERALERTGARLLIVDPIQSYLGKGIDMQRAGSIRNVMAGLATLAEKYRCAVLLIGHMNKSRGSKSLYRSLGSIDIVAAARSVVEVGRLEGWEDIRVVRHIKSSLAPKGEDFAFRLDPMAGFQWIGPIERLEDREQILDGAATALETEMSPSAGTYRRSGSKLVQAETYLRQWLAEETLPCAEVHQRFRDMGIGIRTVAKAKKLLQIHSVKKRDGWYWSLKK